MNRIDAAIRDLVPKAKPSRRQRITNDIRQTGIAASYARFSSDMQNASSNDDQHRENTQAAERNGHTISAEHCYSDKEVSGTKKDREGLNLLMEDAEAGKFSTLYVYGLSRLARRTVMSMSILKRLVEVNGIRIISVSEGIDSDQLGWDMLASILSVFHEQYIAQLAGDVRRAQIGNVLNGYSVGDYRFGYTSVEVEGAHRGNGKKAPRRYQINENEAVWVKKIFQWYTEEKLSITKIVKLLNENKVPKGHRQQVETWSRANVISVLESSKYVGVWAWGLLKNYRDPETDRVWQEPREENEKSDDWIRYLPDLQIVEVDIYRAAQDRLAENRAVTANHRKENGRFDSGRGSRGNPPQHLLSGLFYCRVCQHKFYLGGSNGKYLFCPNYNKGTCSCKTKVRRDLATEMILEKIASTISTDSIWMQQTYEAVSQTWKQITSSVPEEIAANQRAIESIEQKIERLLNRLETGDNEASINGRINQRELELVALRRERCDLEKKHVEKSDPPTLQWVQETLSRLFSIVDMARPAFIENVQRLLGGKIEVEEVSPEKGRAFIRGYLSLKVSDATKLLLGTDDIGPTPELPEGIGEFILDFKFPNPLIEPSEEAKRLYDAGCMNAEIAIEMKISRSMVTKLLKFWHDSRGLEMPDGRGRRSSLKRKHLKPPYYQEISEKVQQLLDEGLLIAEVAEQVGCDINTVRSASQFWHQERGLEYQDGRARRKSLVCKNRKN